MLEYLQIISLILSYLGFLPEVYRSFTHPEEDDAWNKLYIWLIWISSSITQAIYVTTNNIDFLVCIYSYGSLLFYVIIIGKKVYSIKIQRHQQITNNDNNDNNIIEKC
jgi:hypothetical protein